MSPPVKIPLNEKDKRRIGRRLVGNFIAMVIFPAVLIAAIPLSQEVYSESQTILPWLINIVLAGLAVVLFLVFFRLIKRLRYLKADGKKFRERVSLQEGATVYSKTGRGSSGSVSVTYFLEMPDKHTFFLNYRQFTLAKKLVTFYIEYQPYSHDHIDHIQSLDFNEEIKLIQDTRSLSESELVKRIDEALTRIRSRTDKEPDEPGEPADN